MLGLGWLVLRQAQEALKSGRLEDALRLLAEPAVQGHKRCHELAGQLVRALVERAERHLRDNDPVAAWNDLLKAEQPGVGDQGVVHLRQELTRLGLADVRALLAAAEAGRAAELAGQLRDRGVRQTELEAMEEAARDWDRARDLAGRGELAQALQVLERAHRLLPGHSALESYVRGLQERSRAIGPLLGQLHGAAQRGDWQEVLQLAEQVLALAPSHVEARKLRSQAWKSLEAVTVMTSPPQREPVEFETPKAVDKYLLWIDGVGGYLLCLAQRVTFGQATASSHVDIPIFADVSRHHATLTRDAEGYFLEAQRTVQVNGKGVDKALLHSGDRVTLGTSCQFQFRQPVPVSATAVLELMSGHRLRLAVAAVVLMADTLVLGAGPQAHVLMPDLRQAVVLYRHKDQIGIRCSGQVTINGRPCKERGLIEAGATVVGEDFSLGLETVGSGGGP